MRKVFAFSKAFALSFALMVFFSGVQAQEQFIPDPGQQEATPQKPDEKQQEREKQIKKYEDTIKDAVKAEGPFVLYLKEKEVYWELRPSDFGKYFFLQAALRTGAAPFGLQAGEPIAREFSTVDAFRFERQGDEVWLYLPNLAWRWAQDDPLAIAAQRTFPDAILDSFKIEVEHPDTKNVLIKVTGLFYGEIFNLSEQVTGALGRPYQLDRAKSRVSLLKGYPENILVRADLHFVSRGGGGGLEGLLELLGLGGRSHLADPRSAPISVTYLIYPRKESDYVPRFADPRVGYFTQDYYDHGRFMRPDRMTRLINRWNLKKKDPTAELSEPVKPIVWYIDDSVPEQWREACAEGILRWNKAFERIGIKNAIEVRYKPKDADWDHADMRYNVLRFVASENAGYAVALFRTDPFTGEILNASITVDANMVFFVGQEYEWLTRPAHESWTSSLARFVHSSEPAPVSLADVLRKRFTDMTCELGPGKMESAEFGWMALDAIIPEGTSRNRDEYIKEFLADVVSHEMGHCLGLRHNFAGTTELPFEELGNPEVTSLMGISSSVMDYVPVNIAAVAKGKGHFYSRTIGTYDMFAIEYGYKDVPGETPWEEYPHLLRIASRGSLPGHAFMTDENADSFDPYVVRFDLSKNPLDAAEATIKVAKKLLAKADQLHPKPGRPFSDLVRAVNISLNASFRQAIIAARFVGGVRGRRNFAGDPMAGPTMEPVDPDLQHRAINLIAREILSEDAFRLSDRILLNISPDYNRGIYDPGLIKDRIASLQFAVVSTLLSADTTDLVANNSFKLQNRQKNFTLADLYGQVVGKVFSEVGTGRAINPLRRDLQRFVVEGLITQALAPAGSVQEDVRMLASDILRRLRDRFGKATSQDPMTQVHLRDTFERIDKALKATVTLTRR
jgi:hypothetical protein